MKNSHDIKRRLLAAVMTVVMTISALTMASGCGDSSAGKEEEDAWGISLSVENIAPTGLTLVINQSGGKPTGSLQYGSAYGLEVLKDGEWEEMPYIIEGEVVWDMLAYIISMGGRTENKINFEYLYGSLPAGAYRLSKSIMDFRGAGDYDEKTYYAEFEIE